MADSTVFLKYDIFLTNKTQLDSLIAAFPSGGIAKAPAVAAVDYSAPLLLGSAPFSAPCCTSSWFTSGDNFPLDQETFSRDSGGWFGIHFLFGDTTTYWWWGTFKLAPNTAEGPVVADAPTAMAQRKFVDGFETPAQGVGGTGNAGFKVSRRASRHLQGYGLFFDNTVLVKTHDPTELGAAASPSQWDRLYVRPERFPTSPSRLWRCQHTGGALAGLVCMVAPDGKIGIYDCDSTGALTLMATTSTGLVIDQWAKLDFLVQCSTNAFFQLFIDGAPVVSLLAFPMSGLGILGANLNLTEIGGGSQSGAQNGFTWHADDWIGSGFPTSGLNPGAVGRSFKTAPGFDWNNGSRVAYVGANGLGATNDGFWAGNWRLSRQRPVPGAVAQPMTSSTSGARLTVTTDATLEVDQQVGGLGVAAFIVGLFSKRGTASGQLGWRFGGVDTLTAVTQATAAYDWNHVMYRPSGVINPLTPFGNFELVHLKGASADAAVVQELAASVEIIGIFGPEDVVTQPADPATPPAVQPPAIGIHNAPYPHSQWARKGVPPPGPVVTHSGTYVGNGTFQDLVFRVPVQVLFVRDASSGGNGGFLWFSSMNAAHPAFQEGPEPHLVIEALQVTAVPPPVTVGDQEQQTIIRLAGASANSNAGGVTYQYTAFCDPALRFVNCGALAVYAGTADFVSHLDADAFTPEAVLLMIERDSFGGTVRFWYKGIGHATGAASVTTAAESASALAVSNGTLTSKTSLYLADAQQIAYAAFRRNDGSGDPGVASILQLASYTGDGSASRTISLAPLSGKRPLWAMVVPHNAAAIYRDASHTGTTSTQVPTTNNASTGITAAGVDSLSVGSALNAGGIVYDVFVLPGGASGCNGGFSCNGEFIVIDPSSLPGGPGTPFDPTPPDPSIPVVVPPPTDPSDPLNPIDYATLTCLNASTVLVNMALSALGVSKRVVDLLTDQTQEASTARLHYGDNINAVLRDFPWPFATRYATLPLVAGTATASVNGDWQFSYRTPIDCIYARRIVNPDGVKRAFDPDPVKFRPGSDAGGGLIYCDQDGTVSPVELEYTVRSTCAATDGDALFRTALVWRLAHLLAPTLCRDEKKVVGCWQMYQGTLITARTVAARESQQDPDGDADWITGRN